MFWELNERFSKSKIRAPKEAGINREKEKLKAVMGDKPSNNPAKMVEPAREIPGRMAKAWNRPIIKACLTEIVSVVDLKNLVEKTKIKVIKKKIGNNLISEKISSIWSLNNRPTTVAGSVPTIILTRFFLKKSNLAIKKTMTDKKVAVLRNMSKDSDGVRPK